MQEKLQQAFDLCNKNKYEEALSLLEEITKNDPQNSEAWRALAQVHWYHQNEPDKAFDELIEALKCDPQNLWALILMGNLLTKEKKDIKTAKQYYDKVLKYHPNNAIAINNIGATYMECHDYESALPYMMKALAIDDSYANSYYGLALCYYKLNRIEDAFEICHKGALKSSDRPENPSVREELIKLYITVAKEYADKTNYLNVWKGIKDELEAVDYVNIRITDDRSLNVHAKLEYAPLHAAKEHVIRYNPEKDYVEHLFIHEMMHLKMSQQATIANRSKAVVSSERTRTAFKKRFLSFMKKRHSHIPLSELDKAIIGLADGLGLQLMNCPLDLFVENMIYTDYKIVRPIQMLSLFHMEQDNINAVKQAASNGFFPKEIVYANKVMNIVTSLHFKDLYGINLIGQYNPTKQEYKHAQDLYEEFKAYLNTYKAGDEYEMLEYFVQSFNMDELIEIIDEKQVTPGMKADLSMKSDLKDLEENALSIEDTEAANAQFAQNHQDGADPTETMMMSLYMLGAMEYFDTLTPQAIHRIALEIAMVGVTGIDPKKKYSIKSIPDKEFGGYQFLAYYYVSWARAIPHKLNALGLPFSKAYESALQMYNSKKNM
ncbi:MAG: tetratricopeptide repeat protein [Prevotella sp.]|nr:tetratricopeptide repeat protein [Prevotella sp.]